MTLRIIRELLPRRATIRQTFGAWLLRRAFKLCVTK